MNDCKNEILGKLCYTELVYGRINKKLSIDLSKSEIENLIFTIIKETDEAHFQKVGKNIYVANNERNIMLTINSFTNRIITADKLTESTKRHNRIFAKICQIESVAKLASRNSNQTLNE